MLKNLKSISKFIVLGLLTALSIAAIVFISMQISSLHSQIADLEAINFLEVATERIKKFEGQIVGQYIALSAIILYNVFSWLCVCLSISFKKKKSK